MMEGETMKLSMTNNAVAVQAHAAERVPFTEAQIEDRLRIDEERRLAQGAKRLNRPAWARTWAFPAYTSISEFV